MKNELINIEETIESKIYTIRGLQVMLDSDLAELYGVETKQLNKAVNRNLGRFPSSFRFQLTKDEFENLRFQSGTSREEETHGGRRYLPFVFTEQGVSMLSAVLRSQTAIEISIKIIETFVAMRKFLLTNAGFFERFERVEERLLVHDQKLNKLFQAIESKDHKPDQGIFFDGQIYDAYTFVNELIRSAKKSIVLFDNYIDDTVLTMLSQNQEVLIRIYTKNIDKKLELDIEKYNAQYKPIVLEKFELSHDRFLIVDDEIYHIGTSLKDLGKKWFAFSKMEKEAVEILGRV